MYKHIFAEIDLDALEFNIDAISSLVPTDKIMAVVKANAYGHGAGGVSALLEEKGVRRFAVSNVYEALDLRKAGVKGDILTLGYAEPELVKKAAENNITLCVYDLASARAISVAAGESTVSCHIKLDTGMGRLGFNARKGFNKEELKTELSEVLSYKNLNITGGFTHFATSDRDGDKEGEFALEQYKRFLAAKEAVWELVGENAYSKMLFHSSNSAATLLDYKNRPSDLYRAGIILYGLTPSKGLELPIGLKPVMSLKATVSSVKKLAEGDSVSYGRTFVAEKPMKIAALTVGYADGYMRGLSGRGEVLIGDKKAPIVGRVCMDQVMVDVTGLEVSQGDTVTLFGKGLPAEELADILATINYEIVCAVAHRVPRVYIKNGKVVDTVRYNSI